MPGSRHLWLGEAGADEEWLEFRVAAHEAAVEFVGGGGAALAEDVPAEGAAAPTVEAGVEFQVKLASVQMSVPLNEESKKGVDRGEVIASY